MADISAQGRRSCEGTVVRTRGRDRRKMSTNVMDVSGVERRFSKEDRSECRRNVTRTREPVDCEPTEWRRPWSVERRTRIRTREGERGPELRKGRKVVNTRGERRGTFARTDDGRTRTWMRARTSKDERERRHREGEHDVIVERRLRTSGHPAANTDVTVERRARSWDPHRGDAQFSSRLRGSSQGGTSLEGGFIAR